MDTRGGADLLIRHPCRTLICGKSRSGKTTLAVSLIKNHFITTDFRIIVICPNYDIQKTFDPLRKYVQKEDVYLIGNDNTMDKIQRDIDRMAKRFIKHDLKPPKTLIFIDDFTGNRMIHGNGKGSFAEFAVKCNHVNTSLMVVAHAGRSVDPRFRENTENLIIFPDLGSKNADWLVEEYKNISLDDRQMRKLISTAWHGGPYVSEYGKHFLFIHNQARGPSRFFIDFSTELFPNERKHGY